MDVAMIAALKVVWRQNCLIPPWVTALGGGRNGNLGQGPMAWGPIFKMWALGFHALVSLKLRDVL